MELAKIGKDKTGARNLVLSGGVSMNSSMNGKMAESGMFNNVFALPMSSDRGIAIGAALNHIHNNLDVPRFYEIKNVFMGNDFTEKEALKAAKKSDYKYYTVDDPIETAARFAAEGKVVGWYQGASEMGARALGHRSIVADPRQANMKDIINEKVKHREWFRPFAPSVMDDKAMDYFDYDPSVADMSFMTYTVKANERAQKEIPAVVHVDNTSRIQTVIREENPMYYDLIKKFGEITGVNVVLNTSFNDNGEPIVETPQDAVNTFGKTGMDVLVMHNLVLEKK
jgi:carbamoyltransferase